MKGIGPPHVTNQFNEASVLAENTYKGQQTCLHIGPAAADPRERIGLDQRTHIVASELFEYRH
jgi:hypothetical protein